MKEAQLQWSQAQPIQKKLCTSKFFTFWYPFFLLPKLKRGNNWIILSFTLKASYLTITWILLFVTNHVTECLRKIPSELISKIYVYWKFDGMISAIGTKFMNKLRRVERIYLQNQSFIDQSLSLWRRVSWYPRKLFTGHVSSDKHCDRNNPSMLNLNIFSNIIVVLKKGT